MKDLQGTLLGVFGKYWQPGSVKTRLAAAVGAEAAASLQRVFLEVTVQRLGGLAESHVLCYWPVEREREFQQLCPRGWRAQCQAPGTLGERMEDFFEQAFARGSRRVVLVGSDTPSLPAEHVARAFSELERVEVVLGPASDGGYYLIGARASTPRVFGDIEWSTPRVWQQTLDALRAAAVREGSGYAILPPWFDVDTLTDLRKLRQSLTRDGVRSEPLRRLVAEIDHVAAFGSQSA